eukprot:scaffold84692_cov66-Phaeocystis_antarctica.AAC.10
MGIIGQYLQRASGRLMTLQGQFKRRAHIASLIIVHVGVGQRCRAPDEESPAILPTVSTRNVPAGQWKTCHRRFKTRAHVYPVVVTERHAI